MIGRAKCSMCKNRLDDNLKIVGSKCKAFPEGIPEEKVCFIDFDPCNDCNNGIGFEPEEENESAQ